MNEKHKTEIKELKEEIQTSKMKLQIILKFKALEFISIFQLSYRLLKVRINLIQYQNTET